MRSIFIAVCCACAVLFVSCQKGFVFRVFNHTGSDLVLLSYDTEMHALEYSIKTGAAEDIASPTALTVTLPSGGRWEYEMRTVPRKYWYSRSSLGKSDIRLQIEPDGLIYVLEPGTPSPVVQLPKQPEGFPLHPRRVTLGTQHQA